MQRDSVTVNAHTLSFLRLGDPTSPKLILLHGFTDAAVVWQSLIPHLAQSYDVIAYDARGHGQSSRVTARFTLRELAQDCISLLDALGIAQAVLIGHSMGAATAYFASVDHPERVARAVYEDPPFYFNPPSADMQAWKQGTQTLQASPREAIATLYREQYIGWQEEDIQTRVDARLTLDTGVFELMDWGNSPSWQDALPRLRVPSLLITGDVALGGLVAPDVAQTMADANPYLQLAHVANASHHVRCTQFRAYHDALMRFLRTP